MKLVIEKSGTGIEKSGTGIEKSGTGIEKSGTGLRPCDHARRTSVWMGMLLITAFSSFAHAAQPSALLTQNETDLQLSVHTAQGIFAGTIQATDPEQTFFQIDLHDALTSRKSGGKFNPNCNPSGLSTHGAGTGSVRPCSGSVEQQAPESGLMTHGAGTGSLNPCTAGTLGAQHSGLQTHGAGTGSVNPCSGQTLRWGQAEIVLAPEGAFILIHQDGPNGAVEILADFQAAQTANQQLSTSDTDELPNRWLTRN